MKLSVFTTATNPHKRGDNYADAIACYADLADEVIVINGGEPLPAQSKVTIIDYPWPQEFSWEFIGQQFQRGYEAATGDWVIHADLDFLFHDDDLKKIRDVLSHCSAPAMSLYKWQFTMPDRYNLKSRLVVAVNKKMYGDRIRFASGGDLCQPSLDGVYLSPNDVPECRIPLYNYEKLLKTEAQIEDDVQRMARAWTRHFKTTTLGTNETAYKEWLHMALGRLSKPHQYIQLHQHPIYVQETILNLQPDQWGYSGFGHTGVNRYA